jgi:hypothetical protein
VKPAVLDLDIYRGDKYRKPFQFTTALPIAGNEMSVAGRTYAAQIRRSKNNPDVVATFNIELTDPANGRIAISLTHEIAAALPTSKTLRWDLEETANGEPTTIVAGRVAVTGDVTRVEP